MITPSRLPSAVRVALIVGGVAVAAPPVGAGDATLSREPRAILDDFKDDV
jgi:hypothetical protein